MPQDSWVRAYDLHPSERAGKHHALAFAVSPGLAYKPGDGRFAGLDVILAHCAPGLGPVSFPEGCGKSLTKVRGTRFAFRLHYTTSGKPVTDNPRLGLYLSTAKPAHEVRVASLKVHDFVISPGTRETPVQASLTTHEAVTLIELAPHMTCVDRTWPTPQNYPTARVRNFFHYHVMISTGKRSIAQ